MRYREWLVLLCIAGLGMSFANYIGFKAPFTESLPGVMILLVISFIAIILEKYLPFKVPIIAYCSIIGLLFALPFSPISEFVIESANKINFTAPLTMVGAFAGMSISSHLKTFAKQGWKMVFISVLVMTGTFFGSLILSEILLKLTGAI